MKKKNFGQILIAFGLALCMVLSAFSSVFALDITVLNSAISIPSAVETKFMQLANTYDNAIVTTNRPTNNTYHIYAWNNSTSGVEISPYIYKEGTGTYYVTNKINNYWNMAYAQYYSYYNGAWVTQQTNSGHVTGLFWDSSGHGAILLTKTTIYDTDKTTPVTAPITYKSVTLKPKQQIIFTYTDTNKTSFIKTLTSSNYAMIYWFYSQNGQDLSITAPVDGSFHQFTDTFYNRTDLSDFPTPRTLSNNEVLAIRNASGVSTRNITIVFDENKCLWSLTSSITGLVQDSNSTLTNSAIIPTDGMTGVVDLNDNTNGVNREDYQEGIAGDVEYGFDVLFSYLLLPFKILLSFITSVAEVVQYAMSCITAFNTAMMQMYGVLPTSIGYLFVFAVTITVLKLLFGR